MANLTAQQKSETGSFYTPKMWADLAVKRTQKVLGEDLTPYVFYDPACGEGALLEALPANVEKYGSTLEDEDVAICRKKGFEVVQFDFLNDPNLGRLPYALFGYDKPLIVFTNPPYIKLKGEQNSGYARDRYGEVGRNDSVYLFYLRITHEFPRLKALCAFNKLDILKYSPATADFWEVFAPDLYFVDGFMTNSKTWTGLKGTFPIIFNMFLYEGGKRNWRTYNGFFPLDLYEVEDGKAPKLDSVKLEQGIAPRDPMAREDTEEEKLRFEADNAERLNGFWYHAGGMYYPYPPENPLMMKFSRQIVYSDNPTPPPYILEQD